MRSCGGAKSISRAGVARSLVAQSSGGAQPCSEKASALAAVVRATSRRGDTGTAPRSISDGFAALPAKSTGRAGAESSDAVAAVLERTVALYIVENVVAPSEEAPESECTHTLS